MSVKSKHKTLDEAFMCRESGGVRSERDWPLMPVLRCESHSESQRIIRIKIAGNVSE